MDRGIATKATIQWLQEQGYGYLVVSRERQPEFDPSQAETLQNASGETLRLNRKLSEDGTEVRLYCYSEQRAEKEKAIDQRAIMRFEAGLDKIAAGLGKPRCTQRLDKLWERIGRLKAQCRGVGQHYDIQLTPDADKRNAVALSYQRKPRQDTRLTHPGVYCLRSSQTDWTAEQLWQTYVLLTDLEAVFRSLKSELGLRPVFHHKPERADGHLFIRVLAYQFVQIIRKKLAAEGIHASWQSLRRELGGQVRITTAFRRTDGRALRVRKATQPEGEHRLICQKLGIDPQPGGCVEADFLRLNNRMVGL